MDEALRVAVLQRQLEGVAEEMGAVLVRSASSANIKERHDSSCAVFDANGALLAQAAHIPVHLGSMSHAVAAVLGRGPLAGELWLLNDPYAGGTHLPDLTLVTSLHDDQGERVGLAAVRAHHADVGGDTAGSMRATASDISVEGVRIAATVVGTAGQLRDEFVDPLVSRMRQPAERRADLAAQAGALHVAVRRVPGLAAARGGRDAWRAACRELLDYGARRAMAACAGHAGRAGAGERTIELPGGAAARLAASVRVSSTGIEVDLTGSSAQTDTSLNCPRPVTCAAVLFAVRALLDPGLPSSGGLDAVVRVVTRPATVVDAAWPAAVAGGNVEVSSVVVDAVFAAFADAGLPGVPADGQGTMNNLVIGNERFSYYETIAGGQGAGVDARGPDAVQVAMTNTRNTPIEVLELEFPLEVERYAVRRGSGGAGQHVGGDGVLRAIRVLEPCTVSLLTQRRMDPPRGRGGGADGAAGEQSVDGSPADGLGVIELAAGQVVEVRTPGGGGYGPSASSTPKGQAPSA
jgi:N-methylhydantoinase B